MSTQTEPEDQEVRRLIELMKDPRYWRDHDSAALRNVRAGFRRLDGTSPTDRREDAPPPAAPTA